MKLNRIQIASILTALALPAFAADEHKHAEGAKHAGHDVKTEVKIPETAEALWTEIDTRSKALADLVNSKKAEGIHANAQTLEGLVAAISAKYPALAAEKIKRIEGMAKNVARTLDQLHDEAEAGDWDDAAKKLTQVQSAIQLIRNQTSG